jgi:uncharacterized membrane protein YgcG
MKLFDQINTTISTRIFQTIFLFLAFVSLYYVYTDPGNPWAWMGLALSVALEIGRSLYIKSTRSEAEEKRDMLYRFFFQGIRVVIVILLLIGVIGSIAIYISSECGSCAVYKAVGLNVIILWACVFLGYFIWAVYFYNINLGLSEEEWDKIRAEKIKKSTGQLYEQAILDEEPKYNPYQDQTFGLPSGTVRGMIAFTLLFGAISVLIVSFGMKNEIQQNTLFHDQYEFFKTAFLMMIAFYFGSRSLEILSKEKTTQPAEGGAGQPSGGAAPAGGGGGSGGAGGSVAGALQPALPVVEKPAEEGEKKTIVPPVAAPPKVAPEDRIIEFLDPMKPLV